VLSKIEPVSPGGRSASGWPQGRPALHRLAGGMGLASQMYWLIQDDWNGGLRTSRRAADVMVAAAVLAELVGQSAITVERSRLVVLAPIPRLDELGFEVVAQIAAEPGLTPLETIDGLAPSIRDRVARRLIKTGGADQRRVGLRRRRVAVARDGDIGPAWVHANLVNKVDRGLPLTEDEGFLLHLVRHSSTTGNPLAGIPPGRVTYALRQVDGSGGVYRELLRAATDAIRTTAVAR
jgi:hypothetical protein